MDGRNGHGVVVGVDGSAGSEVAVRWAAREAALRRAPLTLAHVVSPTSGAWRESSVVPEWLHGQRERGQAILSEARRIVAETCQGESVCVRTEMPSGHAVSALVEMSHDAALAVVGCLGNGTLRGRHLGSVSSGLTHHAHCPVAVIHDGIALDADSRAPVLVGVDGSAGSDAATDIAFEEAALRGVGVEALHAWKDVSAFDTAVSFAGKGWPALHSKEESALEHRLADPIARHPGVPVRRIVVRDDASRSLVDQSRAAQLVVVGSRGNGGFAGMLLGSVSAAVVLLARVPVLVARGRGMHHAHRDSAQR
jgi:nucleotide-binding universal stress UspA family protein